MSIALVQSVGECVHFGTTAERIAHATEPDGHWFFELDTGLVYLRAGGAWVRQYDPGDWRDLALAVDFTTTSAAAVDVPGLAFTPDPNTTYDFEAFLMIRTTGTTVNPRVGLAWATGLVDGTAMIQQAQSGTTQLLAQGNIAAPLLIAAGGLPNTTQSWPARLQGTARAGASPSGSVRVQLASETAGQTVTIRAFSHFKWRTITP